jgi:hypothetical protein
MPLEQIPRLGNQFLKSHDPQISMLRKFADAIGVSVTTVVRGD